VIVDAAMLNALLQALLDWCFEHARSHIEFRLDLKPWPEHARLNCQFSHVPADEVSAATSAAAVAPAKKLESMPWQLLRHLAQTLGLVVQRNDTAGDTRLSIEFPRTVGKGLAGKALLDFGDEADPALNSQPLAGRHVLVIVSRRDTRSAVRESVRPMGLMVDYVGSVLEAREFCASGLPHAIVFESGLAGTSFHALREEWLRDSPTLGFIEIGEQGHAFEVTDFGGSRNSRVAHDAIIDALPNALLFELAKS
jgi:hypothetical protein